MVNAREVWRGLHEAVAITPERTAPCPVVIDYLSRGIKIQTNTPLSDVIGLDVGCGIGRNTAFLLDKSYCSRFVGIDQTDAILDKSRIYAAQMNLVDRCSFQRAFAGKHLRFADASFDFVMDVMAASTFIASVDERMVYGAEICRLLKPGGVLFVFTGRLDGVINDKLGECAGLEPGTFRRSLDGMLEKAYTEAEIRGLFPTLDAIVLEPQSHYTRAFGDQDLYRLGGFWFSVFRKVRVYERPV